MDGDDKADLLFQTYYMMDWRMTGQADSDLTCISCGGKLRRVGPLRDRTDRLYDGLVCHNCKSIFWVRKD